MLDFHEKRRLKGILFSKFSIVTVFALAALMAVSAYERYEAARDTAEKRAERTIELERLKMRATALESQVEYLESDHGIEAEIREQYDVARPNEKVVIIMGESSDDTLRATEESLETSEEKGFWQRILFWR